MNETEKNTQNGEILGYAVNMAAAAQMTGFTLELCKAAKRARDCNAFRTRGDVDCDALVRWADKHPEIVEQYNDIPNIAIEEAYGARAERFIKEEKLSVIRKSSVPKETTKRAYTKAIVAGKLKLLRIGAKLSQALSMTSDSTAIARAIDAEVINVLRELERQEWFDPESLAEWIAGQPNLLQSAKEWHQRLNQ